MISYHENFEKKNFVFVERWSAKKFRSGIFRKFY